MRAIEVGDYVRLAVRESPHHDDPSDWWKVTAVTDTGIDVVYERALVEHSGNEIVARRLHVGFDDVSAYRKPNSGETS